ncbi:MAG: hypothetical protein ACLP05_12485 [Candidatus Kryptoniota bacterium]
MKPAIVISAYDRPEALSRLLGSIDSGTYSDGVPLILSVDFGGLRRDEVLQVADAFVWRHGDKMIIKHECHLGLSSHTLFVGSLAAKYGSIIRLEDDYFVSPMFYDYASRALEFYRDEPRVAGISLYNVCFNGVTKEPFIPYLDDGDIYFVQSSWSQGQVFLASHWEDYISWYTQHNMTVSAADPLHESMVGLDKEEWFPSVTKYLVETNRFYVFPRESYCTNFGDPGTHFSRASRFFQVPLQTRQRSFRFQRLDDSLAVYDAFQEIMPDRFGRLTHELDGYDYEMDLNGTKKESNTRHQYVVTSQPCVSPVRTWGLTVYPREANIVDRIPGSELKLCLAKNLRPGGFAGLLASFHQYEYAQARLSVGLKKHVVFWTLRQVEKVSRWCRSFF